MSVHPWVGSVVVLGLTVGVGVGGCKKKPLANAEFAGHPFPLIEGSSYTYDATFRGRQMQETRVVVPVTIDGAKTYAFVESDEVGTSTILVTTGNYGLGLYRLKPDGVYTYELGWMSDAPELGADDDQLLLPVPATPGHVHELTTDNVDRDGPMRVAGLETITVPAGTFENCVHLTMENDAEVWLAPGVGLVKWVLPTGRVEQLQAWTIPGLTSGP